jgi:hypothetical protein
MKREEISTTSAIELISANLMNLPYVLVLFLKALNLSLIPAGLVSVFAME